ncbi:unnamed protein product, partial [Polarella glacialis]
HTCKCCGALGHLDLGCSCCLLNRSNSHECSRLRWTNLGGANMEEGEEVMVTKTVQAKQLSGGSQEIQQGEVGQLCMRRKGTCLGGDAAAVVKFPSRTGTVKIDGVHLQPLCGCCGAKGFAKSGCNCCPSGGSTHTCLHLGTCGVFSEGDEVVFSEEVKAESLNSFGKVPVLAGEPGILCQRTPGREWGGDPSAVVKLQSAMHGMHKPVVKVEMRCIQRSGSRVFFKHSGFNIFFGEEVMATVPLQFPTSDFVLPPRTRGILEAAGEHAAFVRWTESDLKGFLARE